MTNDLDELLHSGPPSAPADFSARVMQQITALPLHTGLHTRPPTRLPQRPPRWQSVAQWLALIAAAALGMSQVLAFIFGLWAVTAAAAA